jgi:hypothetical protein
MSQENVEVVRQYFAAPDDVGVMRGPDAMRDYLRQWEETSPRAGLRSRS